MAPDGSNYASFATARMPQKPAPNTPKWSPGRMELLAIGMGPKQSVRREIQGLKDTPTLVHKFGSVADRWHLAGRQSHHGQQRHPPGRPDLRGRHVAERRDLQGQCRWFFEYQVVYNPDQFAFSKAFVAGDDGMLYGISKEGVQQLAADGSGKPPTTVVAFDAANFNYTNNRGMTNILFHDGAVYGMHGAAIYKVTLPKAGAVVEGAPPYA